ncbi:methyltransferase domain-containing protein [Branchiibius sp. NY16-3462-2]|uniref:methyltransferase domain-containing protein n=1 Tax=Branchiibius sp. NY16-3462-2 TaxID=1807500 RepID=UPI000797428B|nr:methyltransferase domain-containing protein [Branchiibius sp. NY16-3462-2]KYH44525.1 23S rRNA (uracil(747)-C(5))-methyltransferase [Branchiibius sp. NY16-3462-2]
MQCGYFDEHRCRSCELMGLPYAEQLADLDRHVRAALPTVPSDRWSPPAAGPESHFRNKAKLVVGGRRGAPTLGILDTAGRGVDLRNCGLYEPGLHAALPHLADFVAQTGLTPYDVPNRTGELKHLLVTHSPDGELMIRFVLRSTGQLAKLERALPDLLARLPQTRVVSVNLLPEHRAAVEGSQELVLTQEDQLPMRLPGLTLFLGPQAFFQTNTTVATMLYQQAQQWVSALTPHTVWDLFCGVGGFGLHVAIACHPAVLHGIEISSAAVASAQRAAGALDLPGTQCVFEAADAERELHSDHPDLLIVNPPRRGIGTLATRIEESGTPHVLYSSCNATSLARDLAAMPSMQPVAARAFAMFPQTQHHEVLVLLRRTG